MSSLDAFLAHLDESIQETRRVRLKLEKAIADARRRA